MDWRPLLFSFDGRISRRTYWLRFVLPASLVVLFTIIVTPPGPNPVVTVTTLLAVLFSIPVGIKRCHDRNRPGWFLLVGLIPFVGALWLFIELGLLRGTIGPNRYGPDPLAKPVRPIKYIIAEGLDVSFYATKAEAENSMEAIDVRNGEYIGYDAEGRLLAISPSGQAAEIRWAEEEPAHAEELRNLLIKCLDRRNRRVEGSDLASLLAACAGEVR